MVRHYNSQTAHFSQLKQQWQQMSDQKEHQTR
jgi:predicted phage gp36 major capsid-like protein